MNQRDSQLLDSRPRIPSARISQEMTTNEQFQNRTLRPAIKFQKDLLLAAFKNYIKKHKNVFYELPIEKRFYYVENAVQKDMKFRNSLKGMVIGQFTTEEYSLYIRDSSALNKRMMGIVKECIQDSMQLLEAAYTY